MKTSKRILTAVLSSALSAIMLFGSTTTALAVENNMVAVSKSTIPGWVDERFTDELKESISKMDYDDTLFVVYDIDPKALSHRVKNIYEYAKSIGREDEVFFSEEENIYYAPDDLIEMYYEDMNDLIMENAHYLAEKLQLFSETLVCFDFLNFKAYLYATESDIFEFSELENSYLDCFYGAKLDLADPVYFDEEHGITWDDYSNMVDLNLKYLSEKDNTQYFNWQFYPYISYDYVDGKCLVVLSSFENYSNTPTYMRVDNKYVCFDRQFGGAYLFYEDGEIKNPVQMYDAGKITLEEYYTLGAFLGDVNYDQKVDVTDVTHLQMYLAGYKHSYEEEGEVFEFPYIDTENQLSVMVADINNDSKIDVTDVTTLQMMLTGYELDFEQ